MLKEDFLESYFQYKIDEAATYSALPAPEETPYENFYKAREILKAILEDQMLQDEQNFDVVSLKGVLHYQLGLNSFETEENSACRDHLKKSLDFFSRLPVEYGANFFNQIQAIYNMLGLMALNSQEVEVGLAYLLKSEKLYEKSVELINHSGATCCNNMDNFYLKLRNYSSTPEMRKQDPRKYAMVIRHPNLKPIFKFYYEGGLDIEQAEKTYTLTCFYLAQSFAKHKDSKEKSAYYCGITLKRQVDCGDYEPKEWANNSMGLSEYYNQERMFSQALYILFTGLEILPPNRSLRTRASLRIMIGNILNSQLSYNVNLIRSGTLTDAPEKEVQQLEHYINKQQLKFDGVNIEFPTTKIYQTYDEVKTLFKMIMTEYRKALEVYPLDGYVTEHCNVIKEMSRAYKTLSSLETDLDRRVAMEFKRKELIEGIYKVLNPKVYIGLWREFCIELAGICNSIFDTRRHEIFMNDKPVDFKDKKVRTKVKQMTEEGLQSIDVYEQACAFFDSEDYKDEQQRDEFIQSVINAKFAIAKTYNGLVPADQKTRIDYLKKSLENYKYIKDYIKQKGSEKGSLNFAFTEQLKLSNEMCEMLPMKIDKIIQSGGMGFM